jgi:hypothetical protein
MRIKILLISLCLAAQCTSYAAEFVRESMRVVRMDGPILDGDVERLKKVYTSSVTLLRVKSEGGDTLAGMLLGRFVRHKHLDLEVNGLCASSCANYVFPAARKKLIPRGSILAFHGTAYTTSLSSPGKTRRMLIASGISADQTDAAVPDLIAVMKKQAIMERGFAVDLHISEAFYRDFLQVADFYDNHYAGNEEKDISVLWWPSAQRLRTCYGITNVDDQARPAVLARGGRYYDEKVSSIIVGDQGLAACTR